MRIRLALFHIPLIVNKSPGETKTSWVLVKMRLGPHFSVRTRPESDTVNEAES